MSAIIMWCLAHLNYWTIILFMAVESSFIPFPSEVVVPPAAWLAANGENGLNIVGVINAETFFDHHGASSTFFGRLVPAVRQLISIPAGLANMHFGKFILFTTLGAGAWNIVLATIGYSLSKVPGMKSTEDIANLSAKYSHTIGYAILAIVAVVLLVIIIKETNKKHKKQ